MKDTMGAGGHMVGDGFYTPFSEPALRAVLGYHRQAAGGWKEGTKMRALHDNHAAALVNTLASIDAMRDRIHSLRLQLAEFRGEGRPI